MEARSDIPGISLGGGISALFDVCKKESLNGITSRVAVESSDTCSPSSSCARDDPPLPPPSAESGNRDKFAYSWGASPPPSPQGSERTKERPLTSSIPPLASFPYSLGGPPAPPGPIHFCVFCMQYGWGKIGGNGLPRGEEGGGIWRQGTAGGRYIGIGP